MNTENLLLSVLFSSIGFGYFLYGKKQKRSIPFICGVALMFYSYFVQSPILLICTGIGLSIIPYFLRF